MIIEKFFSVIDHKYFVFFYMSLLTYVNFLFIFSFIFTYYGHFSVITHHN